MKNITIDFEYDKKGDETELLSINSFYERNKSDHIVITGKRILISGKRGNKHKLF